jgi:ABC-type transport system substrate-binding protein
MYAAMPVVPHDPVAANRILDDHGWRRGADGVRVKNGRPLEITIPVEAGWRGTDQLQEILRAELHDIGAVADTRYFASALMESPQSPVMLGNFDLNPTTSSSMRTATYRPSLDAVEGRPMVGTEEDTVTLRSIACLPRSTQPTTKRRDGRSRTVFNGRSTTTFRSSVRSRMLRIG